MNFIRRVRYFVGHLNLEFDVVLLPRKEVQNLQTHGFLRDNSSSSSCFWSKEMFMF
jgi:hypothetical protein